MDERLAAVLAFDRGIRMRGAQRVIDLPGGVVIRHDGLPILRHLNAVLLDAPLAAELAEPTAFIDLADRQLAGLGHRYLVLDDVAAAERLAPALLDAGWTRERVVYMVRARDADRPPRPGLARRLDEPTARALHAEVTAEEVPADEGVQGPIAAALVRQLVEGQAAVRAGTRSICFGAGEDGQLASICTLFIGDRIAMIEEVGTLTAQRERGLARAVVGAAIDAAFEAGAEEIAVPADADDWPQVLYAKLGFDPLGTQVSFALRKAGR
jgi:hypothetical protein